MSETMESQSKMNTEKTIDDQLSVFRLTIDELDKQMLTLLARRFEVVHAIGEVKSKAGLPFRDDQRWQSMLERIVKQATEMEMDPEFIKALYDLIHEHSVALEEKGAQ